jgi:hypothetical protein
LNTIFCEESERFGGLTRANLHWRGWEGDFGLLGDENGCITVVFDLETS